MKLIKKCRYILVPFSFVYFLIITLRDIFYRVRIFKEHALNARVISVGNITWGGTGKTPLVLFILDSLLKRGLKVAILTRGYGDDEKEFLSKEGHGVSVVVGKDRVKKGIEAITDYSVDTLLLDDGFQYRRLKRDLDILCIDAINPFGNGWLIPVGSMREGLSALKRADIFLVTKVDLVHDKKNLEGLETRLRRVNPKAVIVRSIHQVQDFYRLSDGKVVDIRELEGKDIVLVSAIGNPDSFEKTILNLGLRVNRHFIFRDHHRYKRKDLERIRSFCSKNKIDTIITTEKDAVKLKAFSCQLSAVSFLVLRIKLAITENEDTFFNRLFGIYSS